MQMYVYLNMLTSLVVGVHGCVCIYVCMCVYICMCVYVPMCMYTWVNMYVCHVCVHVCVHVYVVAMPVCDCETAAVNISPTVQPARPSPGRRAV